MAKRMSGAGTQATTRAAIGIVTGVLTGMGVQALSENAGLAWSIGGTVGLLLCGAAVAPEKGRTRG